MTSRDPMTS